MEVVGDGVVGAGGDGVDDGGGAEGVVDGGGADGVVDGGDAEGVDDDGGGEAVAGGGVADAGGGVEVELVAGGEDAGDGEDILEERESKRETERGERKWGVIWTAENISMKNGMDCAAEQSFSRHMEGGFVRVGQKATELGPTRAFLRN